MAGDCGNDGNFEGMFYISHMLSIRRYSKIVSPISSLNRKRLGENGTKHFRIVRERFHQ
jgi:hypothetical protein